MKTKRIFKNKTSIVRTTHNRNNPFVCISKKIIKDKRIGIIEKGILIEILSNSNNFIINKGTFFKKSNLPEKKFNTSWDKLIKLGYLKKERIQSGWNWTVYEEPNLNPNII